MKYMDRTPGLSCVHEPLNDCVGNDYNSVISRRLDAIQENGNTLGFSLNPFKHSADVANFFDPQPLVKALNGGLIISLIRKDVTQQAVSYWLSMQLKLWPGDSDAAKASTLRSYIANKDVEIPMKKFVVIRERLLLQNRALRVFSDVYANQHGLKHLKITYEGLYLTPNPDISAVETALGIILDPDLVTPSKKVLPPPQEWVANYEQLTAVSAKELQDS